LATLSAGSEVGGKNAPRVVFVALQNGNGITALINSTSLSKER
jgi:hypothetical protein